MLLSPQSMAYQIIKPDCLTLNDKLAYYSSKLSQQSLNRIEDHVAVCNQCFQDLYGPADQLKDMAKNLRRFIQYE